LRQGVLGPAYLEFVKELRGIPELSSLPTNADSALAQLRPMIYRAQHSTHPLRHLLLVTWLFGSWARFMQAYGRAETATGGKAVPLEARSDKESALIDARREIVDRVITGGQSATAVARALGKDPTTIMTWLAKAGYQPTRRPRVLKPARMAKLVALLRQGTSPGEAAKLVRVSRATVNRVLHQEVGLHAAWEARRKEDAYQKAAAAWHRCRRLHPSLNVRERRRLESGPYSWLWRNAPDELHRY